MTEADYRAALDAWFAANGHAVRCANLQSSAWTGYFKQGLAPAVAGARIAATAPRNATYAAPVGGGPVPTATAPQSAGPTAVPQIAVLGHPVVYGPRPNVNTKLARFAARLIYWIGLVQAGACALATIVLFLLATFGMASATIAQRPSAGAGFGLVAYLALLSPCGLSFIGFVVGMSEALLGQLALMATDSYERYCGVP